MADRFPSIEDIDEASHSSINNEGGFDLINDSADTTDFLQRERAALGDDADLFTSAHDNNTSVSIQDGEDDLMGGGQYDGGDANMSRFQSSFPTVDARKEERNTSGTTSTQPATTPTTAYALPTEEPQVIKDWRERRSLAIQHREDTAAERKSATIKAAQESIDEFYENYNNKKDKSVAQTKKEAEGFLEKREDTTAGGTSWERIAKLLDVKQPKAKEGMAGKERFKELLLNLSKDENAPGAKGY